ncbi:hypothetical protein [Nostoc sp. ChiQUE01b]|uniref:hypothetical protein n=1 Tax=Nostoc sp. ChiQUE01b TaxID=3075376 RepID=UPI002AD1EAD8|nr:hypothetical protein [Nostoc sp. ChiQUE01b]MDZ8264690.1 hypothetical protein [Nostoc sp. ChiQUE01b]
MLDYLTAGITFWMTLFGVQESLLEFRLGYLGRYWFLAISASVLLPARQRYPWHSIW